MTDTDRSDQDHTDLPDDEADENQAWEHGLFVHLSGYRRCPESVEPHLWPDEDTAAWAASLLSAALIYDDGPRTDATRSTVMAIAHRAAPGEDRPGRLARIGLPILAGQTTITAAAALLEASDEHGIAADLRDLNTRIWPPDRTAQNLPHRLELARNLNHWAPHVPDADLGRIASFAVADLEHFQGGLRGVLRATVHDDRRFRQPFTHLRHALAGCVGLHDIEGTRS